MPAKQVLIGGGTGFIGKKLVQLLKTGGYDVTVVSRMPGVKRITWHELDSTGLPKGTNAIVNVAGQNVLDPTRRWTPGLKQNVWNSRINTTSAMVRAIVKSTEKPDCFINISGVSHYKPSESQTEYTEEDVGERFDFMSKLCVDWEKAATLPENITTRGIKIRTGAVIGREGGMIKSLILPFWFGMGGPIGNGRHYLPWIHINDLCDLIKFSIDNTNVNGILNGVAPDIITNGEFTKAFAKSLKRPAFIPLPESILNLIFHKERAILLTSGAKIKPKRVLSYNFPYKYPKISLACDEVGRLFI